MIITIKGSRPDIFKDSNIGTLSTWTVSRVLGDGATYNGVTYVDKNAALNATVTIAGGYELGSAGVTVTMGGSPVTSGIAVNGNTVTISIGSVTGNVVIKVPTKDIVTGEEDGGGTSGGDVATAIRYLFKDQTFVGYLRGGQYIDAANSATTDYIDITGVTKIGYFGRMGYVDGDTFHAIEFYDANKTYIESLSVLGTGAPAYVNLDLSDSKYANAKYVRASVARSSYTVEQFNSWYFVVGDYVQESNTLETVKAMFPTLGYIGLDGTFVEASSNAYRTDYVSTTDKSTIEYKGRMGTIGLNIAFYDANKTLISGLETVGNGNFTTINIDLTESKYADVKYVVASISRGSLDETTWLSSSFKIS